MLVCPRCRSIFLRDVERCGLDGEELVERQEDPLVGTTLDRYEILERIGQGAMAVVYRARHTVLERDLALKVLLGDYGSQEVVASRFSREAKVASRMRHANIVSVTDFGTSAEGLAFMVMDFVEGRTLAEVIAAEAPFTPQRAAEYAVQIARGLREAHRHGLVHRDVKPMNLMITPDADKELVKILDFGVVRVVDAEVASRLTRTGAVLGTPTYMAPEQAMQPTVGPSADLYSLGVVLYEMLAGSPPFSDPRPAQIVLQHMTAPPPPLASSGGLEELALRLLAKAPEGRPKSADEVVRLIEAHLASARRPKEATAKAQIADLRLDSRVEPPSKNAPDGSLDSGDVTRMQDPSEVLMAPPSAGVGAPPARESPDRNKTRLIRPPDGSLPELTSGEFEAFPSITDPSADLGKGSGDFDDARTAYTEVAPLRFESATPSFGGEERTTLDASMPRFGSFGSDSASTDEYHVPRLQRPDSIEPTRVHQSSDLTPIEDPSLHFEPWPPRPKASGEGQPVLQLRFAKNHLRLREPEAVGPALPQRQAVLPGGRGPAWLWVAATALVVIGLSALIVALFR